MAEIAPIDFVQAELQKQISRFDQARNYYRNGHFWVMLAMATLSALTTLLISVGQIMQLTWVTLMALATSAGMTIATAWEGYFRNKEMWVQKTDTLNQLYELDMDIRYAKIRHNGPPPQEDVDRFYSRYEDILRAANKAWMGVRAAQVGVDRPKSDPIPTPNVK